MIRLLLTHLHRYPPRKALHTLLQQRPDPPVHAPPIDINVGLSDALSLGRLLLLCGHIVPLAHGLGR